MEPRSIPCYVAHLADYEHRVAGSREPVDGVLVEDELIAEAIRARLDVAPGCLSEELVELGGRGHLIGMRVGGARAR